MFSNLLINTPKIKNIERQKEIVYSVIKTHAKDVEFLKYINSKLPNYQILILF